jgi:hypothetical protein
MNKYNFVIRFSLLLLIILSIAVFGYWIFAKINILDIIYYRIEVFDYNEKVDIYRYEIESAIEFLKVSINMVLLCSFLLMLVCVYAFYKSK